jgi:hypothetical protein
MAEITEAITLARTDRDTARQLLPVVRWIKIDAG